MPGDRENLAIQTRGGPEKHEVTGWVLVSTKSWQQFRSQEWTWQKSPAQNYFSPISLGHLWHGIANTNMGTNGGAEVTLF